ncbi:2-dehydropantoate 2-reductase [Iocasia frigidifontis]|uniref:2-dehydropantoate 2-reductase n=1 Tax=Iocasia fonsfrigidae TaxID=2682810 RepID=A0A8A7KCM6_9FIRM|nr:2-dehydropantoate 2-reductase [Iocasia fonsfrigidae]QTL97149.1 2-dehydropantoate 2-reductase [Iocasia fonsfrigidae]
MKILVIGAGAMGSIYGGHLSLHNEVYMVDKNIEVIEKINTDGLTLVEDGEDVIYRPIALESTEDIGEVDLVILFVKSLYSKIALKENQHVLGKDTYILTLQNGAGHEDILEEFVSKNRIILGTTQDNGAVIEPGKVRRGGVGKTNFGMLVDDSDKMLAKCKTVFDACGFDCKIYDNIQQLIWNKLFTNISLSVVTGILQVPIGYVVSDEYAWNMTKSLIYEALQVAKEMGLEFDENEIIERVREISISSPDGLTSIYTDLKKGRKTEVDTISGSVVRAAEKVGVSVPVHEFVVNFVHAMENK